MWAYDLDSVVEIPSEYQGCRTFRFSRILQICEAEHKTTPCAADYWVQFQAPRAAAPVQPSLVTLVEPRPPWAQPLARWYVKWAMDRSRRCGARRGWVQPIVHDWLTADGPADARRAFWKGHECRVWQFPSPRVTPNETGEGVGCMEDLQYFLASWDDPCTTFSSSLCISGSEALGWDDPFDAPGWVDGGKWISDARVRKLLPFYEPMRREEMQRRPPPPLVAREGSGAGDEREGVPEEGAEGDAEGEEDEGEAESGGEDG